MQTIRWARPVDLQVGDVIDGLRSLGAVVEIRPYPNPPEYLAGAVIATLAGGLGVTFTGGTLLRAGAAA